MSACKMKSVCVLVTILMLLCSCSNATSPVLTWPLSDINTMQVNSAGTRVAMQAAGDLRVYKLLPSGELGELIWTFRQQYNNSMLVSFTWNNDRIILSKIDNNTGKDFRQLTESEEELLTNAQGSTIDFDFVTKTPKLILPNAYRMLLVSWDGKYIAAATPTFVTTYGATVSFYDLATKARLGQFSRNAWGPFGTDSPFIIGWSKDNQGIYCVGPNGQSVASLTYGRTLIFIERNGSSRSVTPPEASITLTKESQIPLPNIDSAGLSIFAYYFEKSYRQLIVDTHGVKKTRLWSKLWPHIKDVAPITSKVSLSPSGRFLILQDVGSEGILLPGQMGNIWALDLVNNKRYKLGSSFPIDRAFQWSNGKLLIETLQANGDSERRVPGVLSFDESMVDEGFVA